MKTKTHREAYIKAYQLICSFDDNQLKAAMDAVDDLNGLRGYISSSEIADAASGKSVHELLKLYASCTDAARESICNLLRREMAKIELMRGCWYECI